MAYTQTRISHARRQRINLVSYVGHIISVANERAALRRLDHAGLRDLGLTPEAAAAEANRPFWDVPASRR